MGTNQNGDETADLTCHTRVIHDDTVQRVKGHLPDRPVAGELAAFFKLFGDPTRICILWALSEAEMCVCDLCALLGMKQSAVSQQLKILRQSRIVKNRRDGKVIYYSLDDDHIEGVLKLGASHILEEPL